MNPLKATRVSFFRSSTAFGKSLVSISSVLKLKTNYLPYTSARYTVLNWFAQSDYNKSLGFKEVWKRVKVGNICIFSQKLLYAYSNESALYTSRQQNTYVCFKRICKNVVKIAHCAIGCKNGCISGRWMSECQKHCFLANAFSFAAYQSHYYTTEFLDRHAHSPATYYCIQ